jgi:hypothetical protein
VLPISLNYQFLIAPSVYILKRLIINTAGNVLDKSFS